MLTPQTQIPTHARGQVRALIKAHKDWKAFLDEKGIISASARNADLIEFRITAPPTGRASPSNHRPTSGQ